MAGWRIIVQVGLALLSDIQDELVQIDTCRAADLLFTCRLLYNNYIIMGNLVLFCFLQLSQRSQVCCLELFEEVRPDS